MRTIREYIDYHDLEMLAVPAILAAALFGFIGYVFWDAYHPTIYEKNGRKYTLETHCLEGITVVTTVLVNGQVGVGTSYVCTQSRTDTVWITKN